MDKHWIASALEYLIAFANHPNGGFLAYGIRDADAALVGVQQNDVARIVNTLANIGRDAIEPALAIDHAVASQLKSRGYARAASPARHPGKRLARSCCMDMRRVGKN